MICVYCGRKKGLFEKFNKYQFCQTCSNTVRKEITAKIHKLNAFIESFPAAFNGANKENLLQQIEQHFALIKDLEERRKHIPMFKSGIGGQFRELEAIRNQLISLIKVECTLEKTMQHTKSFPFPKKIDGKQLTYHYDNVNLAYVATACSNLDLLISGHNLKLVQEPENEYDKNAVALYYDDLKIGYLYKGRLQEMVNTWIKNDDPIFCSVNYINTENASIIIFLGFYKDRLAALQKYEHVEELLVKVNRDRQDYLSGQEVGDFLCMDFDDFDEVYIVSDEFGFEIGELSHSVSKHLQEKEDEFELIAVLSKIDYKDEKYRAKIKIYFK